MTESVPSPGESSGPRGPGLRRLRPIGDTGADGSDRGASEPHAYHELRSAIMTGKLAPGAMLSQVQLAETLGVSRTPLRQAVRRLEQEGLLNSEPRRRVRVAPLRVDDLEELFSERIVLESYGVGISVPRLTDHAIGALRTALVQLDDALDGGDHDAFPAPHRAFRVGLFSAAGQRIVHDLVALYDHSDRYRHLYLKAADDQLHLFRLARADYDAMFDAARARDGERTAALVAEHLARSAMTAIAAVDASYDARLIRGALDHITPRIAQRRVAVIDGSND